MKGLKVYNVKKAHAGQGATLKDNRVALGVTAAVGASLAFTFMNVFVKLMPHIDSAELTFFRGVVGLLLLPLLSWRRGIPFFTGQNKGLLTLRGLFGSLGLYSFFLSIQGLTLGDAQILAQMASFFLCFLSPLFLSEAFPRGAVPALAIIAAGALTVVQIWNFDSFNVYALAGLAGAFFSASAYVAISGWLKRE